MSFRAKIPTCGLILVVLLLWIITLNSTLAAEDISNRDGNSMSEAGRLILGNKRKRIERLLNKQCQGSMCYNPPPSKWNVIKLIADGSYVSMRRIASGQVISCNIILPSAPVQPVNVVSQCGFNSLAGIDPGPPFYQVGDMLLGVVTNGTVPPLSFGNNNLYSKTNQDNPIGISFQRCIMAQFSPLSVVPLDTWNCQWVLGFTTNIPQVNQIMAQGNYFNVSRSSNPVDQRPPPYQYVAITGGTGVFSRIKGFIILAPLNLLRSPPKWWYYVVYQIV
jgi:hypothetical protein